MKNKSGPNLLYVKKDEKGNIVVLSFYVDDIIIPTRKCKLIEEIKT